MKNYFVIDCINDSIKVGDKVIISVINADEGTVTATFKDGKFVGAVSKQIMKEDKKVTAKIALIGISRNRFKAVAEAA